MSSNSRSQIAIEQKWLQRSTADVSLAVEPGDWILSLGDDWAFLHPEEGRWYFFDPIHGDWAPSGMAVGEAILLTAGGVTGAKRIPVDDEIKATTEEKIKRLADWCFLIEGEELLGPLPQAEIPDAIDEGTQIWSPGFSQWLTLKEFRNENPKKMTPPPVVPLQESSHRFCTECGTKTHSGDRFCRGCGKAVTQSN